MSFGIVLESFPLTGKSIG